MNEKQANKKREEERFLRVYCEKPTKQQPLISLNYLSPSRPTTISFPLWEIWRNSFLFLSLKEARGDHAYLEQGQRTRIEISRLLSKTLLSSNTIF